MDSPRTTSDQFRCFFNLIDYLRSGLIVKFHQRLKNNSILLGAYSSLTVLILAPLVFVGGLFSYIQLSDSLEEPDVGLFFADPENPQFWVTNQSAKLARNALHELRMFNLDLTGEDGLSLHLPMAVRKIDFVRPGRAFGPYTLRTWAKNGSVIQKGHRLFGHATIQCETCPSVHDYWIYVHVGTEGWFVEIPVGKAFNIERLLLSLVREGSVYLEENLEEFALPDQKIPL